MLSGLDDAIAVKSKGLSKNQRKLLRTREFGAGGRAERLKCVVERVKEVEKSIAELDAQLAKLDRKAEPISLTEIEDRNRKLERAVRETADHCRVIGPLLEKWRGRVPAAAPTDESIDELVRKVEQRESRGRAERQRERLAREIEQFTMDEVELTRQIQLAKAESLEREHRLAEEIAQLRIEVAQLLML
jgi:hypothetical protein